MNPNLKNMNVAQLLDQFKKDWASKCSTPLPVSAEMFFITGVASGLSMSLSRNETQTAAMIVQCLDIIGTDLQLLKMGIVK